MVGRLTLPHRQSQLQLARRHQTLACKNSTVEWLRRYGILTSHAAQIPMPAPQAGAKFPAQRRSFIRMYNEAAFEKGNYVNLGCILLLGCTAYSNFSHRNTALVGVPSFERQYQDSPLVVAEVNLHR